MKKRELKNKKIDRIGNDLLKVIKPSNSEIEKIVSTPQLFDSIKAKIDEAETVSSFESENKPGTWDSLKSAFTIRQAAFASMAFLFVLLSLTFVSNFKESSSTHLVKKDVNNKNQNEFAQTENSFEVFDSTKITEDPIGDNYVDAKKANLQSAENLYKINSVKSHKVSRKRADKKVDKQKVKRKKTSSPKIKKEQPPKVFYSLGLDENTRLVDEDLQVVETELSSSELFALGVNVELENSAPTHKAELLVGRDGVARAIRLVE